MFIQGCVIVKEIKLVTNNVTLFLIKRKKVSIKIDYLGKSRVGFGSNLFK